MLNRQQALRTLAILGSAALALGLFRLARPHRDVPEPGPATVALAQPAALNFEDLKASRPLRIAFIPKFKFFKETGHLSSYWQPAWEGALKAGADFGVNVTLHLAQVPGATDADYVEPQIRVVADLIAHGGIDGLVIAPFDSNRLAPVVEKAIAAHIPTVALDTPVSSDRIVAFVSFDNFNGGKAIGAWVAGRLGGKGRVLILDGPRDQNNAVDRRKGFLAGLQARNIDILNIKNADWESALARQTTRAWLGEYEQIDAILAANDNMAIGAAEAVAETNRKGILITGFDATEAGLAAIRDGRIAATIDQAPGAQARLAILLLVRKIERGETFPAFVHLDQIPLVTREQLGARP